MLHFFSEFILIIYYFQNDTKICIVCFSSGFRQQCIQYSTRAHIYTSDLNNQTLLAVNSHAVF